MWSLMDIVERNRNSLLAHAQDARELSYSPYSNFRVGAALLLTDGSIVCAANVENASYGTSEAHRGHCLCRTQRCYKKSNNARRVQSANMRRGSEF